VIGAGALVGALYRTTSGACKCAVSHLSDGRAALWGAAGGVVGIAILGILVQLIVHAAGKRLNGGVRGSSSSSLFG
jgi:hypothetical protein